MIKSEKTIKVLITICLMISMGILINDSRVYAASKAQKAKAAYSKFLSNIYSKKDYKGFKGMGDEWGGIYFIEKDISGDKVPELILKETYTAPYGYFIYTYKNGKVKKLKEISYYIGGELMYIYPSKHVLVANEGDDWTSGNIYYQVYNGKIKVIAKERDGKYFLNGKSVSKNEFDTYVKKIKKAKRYSVDSGKYKFRKNTNANRKKYLK